MFKKKNAHTESSITRLQDKNNCCTSLHRIDLLFFIGPTVLFIISFFFNMTGRSKLSEKDVEPGVIFDINATRALYQDIRKFNYILKKRQESCKKDPTSYW